MSHCVLITGASGGIGNATALAFARRGFAVGLGYHNGKKRAQALYSQLSQEGLDAVLCPGNVRTAEGVQAMFAAVEQAFGPVDVLVNCAGHAQQKLFTELEEEDWDTMFEVHAKGAFLCCKRALPSMIRAKRGNIINVSSMWGQVGASCEVHYSAAKAAVIGLTKALAKEVGPSGIRVNCVAPGAIDTAMMADFDDGDKEALCAEVPLGRLGAAENVAGNIVFLASDDAAYLTGQVLAPNGGFVV